MGEMADMLLDGFMDWDFDFPPFFGPPRKKKPLRCNSCKKKGLRWQQVNNRWIMFEKDGTPHECQGYGASLDALKILAKEAYTKKRSSMHQNQLLPIPSWDEQMMHDVYWWARRSKDPRTKIGAVLVKPESKIPFSFSYNSPARGVDDNVASRWERPEKYDWVVHAEHNAVLNCAREGHCSKGAIMYTQGIPCTHCADDCVQGGIIEIVVHKQWQDYEKKFNWDKWIDSSKKSEQKFKEAGIKIRVFDGVIGMQGILDGKIVHV